MGWTEAGNRDARDSIFGQSAGLMGAARTALFESRLTPLARLAGVQTSRTFGDVLKLDQGRHLHSAVTEGVTIHETSFFRGPEFMPTLREVVLPQLIERRARERRLLIWSAASSTGQESYSVAMLLCDAFPELSDWDVRILGTDLSKPVVEYARRGRYRRAEVNRGLPARMLVKYLIPDGEEWQVCSRVKDLCEFECGNLSAPSSTLPVFDLVLLRNVLLYLPAGDRSFVLREVHRQTAADGFLVLGSAEQAEESTDLFEAESGRGFSTYRPVRGSGRGQR